MRKLFGGVHKFHCDNRPSLRSTNHFWSVGKIPEIVELLERKEICTKQEVHDMVPELRNWHAALNGKIIVPGPLPSNKRNNS
ncbi:MAG: hypothetical protein K0S45_2436 [Nitrospira sp.]|jgi:hypothetical protein|nr:hypothetical protein [Nitrospira sp.]